ncbi:MAG: diaminopimelate decarboxylase [Gemmatimonadota bacterium]|nr:diaminopimelate decarboxylase [Gemmatimonadota bacterium]
MTLKRLLPESWEQRDGRVFLGGVDLAELAEEYGTPAFVTDEAHLVSRLASFRSAFGDRAALVYAGKAFLCGALVKHLVRAGWWIDVVSTGELEIATRAGMPLGRTLMHGNAKPRSEMAEAVSRGVGRIVVDHPGEIDVLDRLARTSGTRPAVLLRLNADVAAETHEKVKTTGDRAQFGMDPVSAAAAAARADEAVGIELAGVHIHVGSQIRDPDTYRRAASAVVDFVEPLRARFPERVDLDLGGGMPVPYLRDDDAPGVAAFAGAVLGGLDTARATDRLGDYRLLVEPGRSVVATSTITLYRVEARKRLPSGREMIAVDGGLSDNPRPALYGQQYEVLAVARADGPSDTRFHVVGRHCETGDIINVDASLPDATAPGDVVAVPSTGAYAYSMSSRYNGLRRPPVLYVREGGVREVVRRETFDDLVSCDLDIASRL